MGDAGEDGPVPRGMSRTPLPPLLPDAETLALVDAILDSRLTPELRARLMASERVAALAERRMARRASDWADLARYRAANAPVDAPDLVMIGDSITEIWARAMPDMFGAGIANRGIAGQTSGQILLRFYPDVIELRPRRVHILCGTNDIAGNTGPTLPEDYQRNIAAMADVAQAHGIGVVIGSITPASDIFWEPDAEPQVWIPYLNAWLRNFAVARDLDFIDYHAALADDYGALRREYSADGVHVTRLAYHVMRACFYV